MPKPTFRIARENPSGKATPAQCNFLEILLNDAGISGRVNRNGWVSLRVDRTCNYLDELTMAEAGRLIDELKEEDL